MELALSGIVVSTVSEVMGLNSYDRAVPILTKWLPDVTYKELHSDIVECLHTRVAFSALVIEFSRDDIDRWVVGNAIAKQLRPKDFGVVKPLLAKKYGDGRQMLVLRMGRMKGAADVVGVLMDLLDDGDVVLYAIGALGSMRAAEARSKLEQFLRPEFLGVFWTTHPGMIGLRKQVLGELRKSAEKAIFRIRTGEMKNSEWEMSQLEKKTPVRPVEIEASSDKMSKTREHQALVDKIVATRDSDAHNIESRRIYRQAGAGLFTELASTGYTVSDLSELREAGFRADAVAILTKWLPSVEYAPLYADIVKSLRTKKTRVVTAVLLDEFVRDDDLGRWSVGNAIGGMMRDADFEIVRAIVLNRKFRHARQMIVMNLSRLKKTSGVVPLLVDLLSDPDVAMHAIIALGKLKASQTRKHVEQFLEIAYLDRFLGEYVSSDVKKGLQREARKALKKFD
ncbi:MAG: HEAT repeat domain-containing protein [Kofleriaceae bacterium]|nr:HEAT repeat domain-containing protein [Kofleriaceae bacterium]